MNFILRKNNLKTTLDFTLIMYYFVLFFILCIFFSPFMDQNDLRARTMSQLFLFPHTDFTSCVSICCPNTL